MADERALVAGAQAGDERAFRALVDPYRGVLEVHAYRMLGSRHDAEDVVQETLLRAWRALDRFERRASVSTWLYRICTNACLDEIERRPRRGEPLAVDPFPDALLERAVGVAPIVDPAARYAAREGMELALLTAIQRLPGRQRAVLILRDVLGWTGPEVAELLETTVAAVNGALQRARATVESVVPARSSRDIRRAADRELLNKYISAWERNDIDALVALLRDDAVLSMPPQRALHGAAAIREFWLSYTCSLGQPTALKALPAWSNGAPAVAFFRPDGTPHVLLVLAEGSPLTKMYAFPVADLHPFLQRT
ncbi:RNA polymerase subunit sigma-70 [Conexibacter woesei]|uniref:RNA polymerase subunit sigma-70 n=1 Tax=Conexibacter woesei TaxID=191495 RepID=UPI0003FD96B9|nr:RNA polymerase subunit sigma-70 [Conexibacter woesei]